jgi:hypothetical protein
VGEIAQAGIAPARDRVRFLDRSPSARRLRLLHRTVRSSRLLAFVLVLAAATAWASATSPTLIVSAARAVHADGRHAVTIEGTFDFANAVQVGYPLQLVVFQGTRFVRYPAAGAPRTGDTALLADGRLDAAELPAFLAAGAPATADVRVVTLTATSALVALPADFAPGTATAQVFTVLPEEPVLSNPLALVLP